MAVQKKNNGGNQTARRRRIRSRKAKFTRKMREKLVVVFAAVCIALTLLVVRIVYIQKVDGERYSKIVLSQQEYNSSTIPFQRGDITDCNGTILATSTDVYNVVLDCKVINEKPEYLRATVRALTKCFPDLEAETLRKQIKEKKNNQYFVVAKKMTYDQISPFVEIQDDRKNNPNVQGVWFEKEYQRTYPYGSLASTIVGFTASGDVGINGLEKYYNETLNGTNGREYGYLNTDNDFEKNVIEAENGNSIVTTIDANIQKVVEQKIQAFNEQYANNARDGAGSENTAVIVTNPNNGEILAMAEYPTFDCNDPRDLTRVCSQEQIDTMSDEDKMKILNDLWENYCLTQTYEPGSTAKLFTVAAALETGAVSPDEGFSCDGVERIANRDIHCSKRSGHGFQTIEQAVMNSCNDVMMQLASRTGADNFMKYQSIFNIGMKTNIDLPGEARTDSLIYTKDTMNPVALATNSFGQNYNMTMIQMVCAYNSILNGGTYYQPHMVKRILDSKGNTLQNIEPTVARETISKETSTLLKQYLHATVAEGTAKTAHVEGYSMGGKTGTAETLPRKNGQYLVSFIGCVPAENPQVLIYVVVNKPNVAEQADSKYAQVLAKDILTEILPYMNIYPDETGEEESSKPQEDEEKKTENAQPANQQAAEDAEKKKKKKKEAQTEGTIDTPQLQPPAGNGEQADPVPDDAAVDPAAQKPEENQ